MCSSQLSDFSASDSGTGQLREEGTQLLAKASLATDWLVKDLAQFVSFAVPQTSLDELQTHVDSIKQLTAEVRCRMNMGMEL